MNKVNGHYNQIIQTAWPVAYSRTFTDIPYSQEIFDTLINLQKKKKGSFFNKSQADIFLAPQFEARYKILNQLIKQSGCKQVLEFASGLTARGLVMSANSGVRYVETDLPKMTEEKRKIIKILKRQKVVSNRGNLYLENVNALNLKDIEKATRHFIKKPVVVVNEGLLRYLNFYEKAQVAKNVYKILKKFGGFWITPDISMRRVVARQKSEVNKKINKISSLTGRDINKNLFKNISEAKLFFEKNGFIVKVHALKEVANQLVSPSILKIPKKKVNEVVNPVVVFVMHPK